MAGIESFTRSRKFSLAQSTTITTIIIIPVATFTRHSLAFYLLSSAQRSSTQTFFAVSSSCHQALLLQQQQQQRTPSNTLSTSRAVLSTIFFMLICLYYVPELHCTSNSSSRRGNAWLAPVGYSWRSSSCSSCCSFCQFNYHTGLESRFGSQSILFCCWCRGRGGEGVHWPVKQLTRVLKTNVQTLCLD